MITADTYHLAAEMIQEMRDLQTRLLELAAKPGSYEFEQAVLKIGDGIAAADEAIHDAISPEEAGFLDEAELAG